MSAEPRGRRAFLKQVGQTSLALAGSAAAALWLHNRPPRANGSGAVRLRNYAAPSSPSDVQLAIARGTDIDRMVRAAIGEMGGIARFISKDDVVLIKPNVAFDRSPQLGATTRPEILQSIVRLCREAGARKVIVADNPINSPAGAFHKSGLTQAAEFAGAVVMHPRADDFRDLDIGGQVLRTWPVFWRPLQEATKVIGVAPIKDHNLCQASMALKNWYGLLGGSRNRLHQKIDEVIADLGAMITPTLVVLDGTRLLMRNGPTGGSLSDVAPGNTIVCGVDAVAVDAYGFTLLGRDPDALGYLQQAHARGIGNKNWQSLRWKEIGV
jgi:uncharacterized protein (DUF362 family)